jgi:homoserine dehydrogenase
MVEEAALAKGQGRPLSAAAAGRALDDWRTLLPAAPSIIVDTTASDGQEQRFAEAVAAGHRLALANKRPLTAEYGAFMQMTSGGRTRYEATVGAGLPVLSTLQGLLDSGDRVLRIEASLSGTLGYLCGALDTGERFSQAVHTAKARGWTEPDPRDDLSGRDVARKALILARTCGYDWTLDDVPPQAWYPHELANVDVETFMAQIHNLDENYRLRLLQTHTHKAVLRYVATIEPNGAQVGFRELPQEHPLAALKGADNLISFTTERYNERPLVVRGPGAGLDVTAAGVLTDVLALAREMQNG